jgi:hypothetical protein
MILPSPIVSLSFGLSITQLQKMQLELGEQGAILILAALLSYFNMMVRMASRSAQAEKATLASL